MSKENTNTQDFSEKKSKEVKDDSSIEIQDVTYRFEEMLDAMDVSLKNLISVQAQQKALIELVAANDPDKKFEQFIKEMNSQLDNLEMQRLGLVVKKEILTQVVGAAKANEVIARNISMLCKALGIFEA